MRINLAEIINEINSNKSDRIIAHAIASINLFRDAPTSLKTDFHNNRFYINIELVNPKGDPRQLIYFCPKEEQQQKVVRALVEKYGIEVIKSAE